MSSKQISPLLQTWYKWKALRLPWRKRFLVGEFATDPHQAHLKKLDSTLTMSQAPNPTTQPIPSS